MQTDTGHMAKINGAKFDTPKGCSFLTRNADLVFTVGERISVKGGDFRVKSFGKKFIILEGLPGSRIRK